MGVEERTSNDKGIESEEEIKCFKSEPWNNDFGSVFVHDSGDGSFQTFKKRRQLRSSSKIEGQDVSGASTDQDSDTSHDDKQIYSPQAGQIRNGTRHIDEGLEGVTSNGFCKALKLQTTIEIC